LSQKSLRTTGLRQRNTVTIRTALLMVALMTLALRHQEEAHYSSIEWTRSRKRSAFTLPSHQ